MKTIWQLIELLSKMRYKRRHRLLFRIIFDNGKKLGVHNNQKDISYNFSLCKEKISREYIFSKEGNNLTFLDVGGRDGLLQYLLGIKENLDYDEMFYKNNFELFSDKFKYFGVDLEEAGDRIVKGDICSQSFLKHNQDFYAFFDVIYSNNVFEHLRHPWIAAGNIVSMLKPRGIAIIIAPFSLRYHEVPADYFRYTHTGLASLFEDCGGVEILISGYDIKGRRNDWQGTGTNNDICPTDKFGAWRENWFVVTVLKRISKS